MKNLLRWLSGFSAGLGVILLGLAWILYMETTIGAGPRPDLSLGYTPLEDLVPSLVGGFLLIFLSIAIALLGRVTKKGGV